MTDIAKKMFDKNSKNTDPVEKQRTSCWTK